MKALTFFILFTALTSTYVFWATHIGVSVAVITISFLILITILSIYFSDNFIIRISKNWYRPMLYMLIVGPILVIIFTRSVDIRSFVLQLFFLVLYIFSYQVYIRYGKKWMYKVFFVSLMFTIFTGLLSVFYQDFFIKYSDIIGGWGFYGGRAVGFYLQPNTFAFAVNIMFIAIIALSPNTKSIIFIYPLVLLAIILSGSRSNLAGLGIITIFLVWFLVKYQKQQLLKSSIYILVGVLIFIVVSIKMYDRLVTNEAYSGLKSRIDFIAYVLFESDSAKDTFETLEMAGSMQDRLKYQSVYDEMIWESPIVGYGIGVQEKFRNSNLLSGSAHNVIYEILFEGGILYFSFFAFFIITFIKNYFKYKKFRNRKFTLSLQMMIWFMLFYFFFTTTFFKERVTFVVFAVLAAYSMELISRRKTL